MVIKQAGTPSSPSSTISPSSSSSSLTSSAFTHLKIWSWDGYQASWHTFPQLSDTLSQPTCSSKTKDNFQKIFVFQSVPTNLEEFKTANKIQELKLKTCNAELILVVPTKVARSISNEFFRAFCCSSFETLIACELLGVSAQICKSAFCELMENIWRPHCFSNPLSLKFSSFVISCWIYLNIFVKFQFAAGIMLPRNTERI